MKTVDELLKETAEAEEYAKTSPLQVYAAGVFCCSVCAPGDWTAEQVQAETNRVRICGTENGWMVSISEAAALILNAPLKGSAA
ncbi:MAG: hypothetical protein NW206_19755 [Hyphomonadaceae bacterium]|nr:hypothetical protein [Hyphomonadaceae bacterium]